MLRKRSFLRRKKRFRFLLHSLSDIREGQQEHHVTSTSPSSRPSAGGTPQGRSPTVVVSLNRDVVFNM